MGLRDPKPRSGMAWFRVWGLAFRVRGLGGC